MMCGQRNPLSLGLSFRQEGEGKVSASFQAHPGFQGYDGIMHGGMIAALLDAAMTNCLFANGIKALTADLHVRFRKPVPCEAKLELQAQTVSSKPPLYLVRAELLCENKVMAVARAKFMKGKEL